LLAETHLEVRSFGLFEAQYQHTPGENLKNCRILKSRNWFPS